MCAIESSDRLLAAMAVFFSPISLGRNLRLGRELPRRAIGATFKKVHDPVLCVCLLFCIGPTFVLMSMSMDSSLPVLITV